MAKRLDARERVFVSEYLIDLDTSRAAIAAGYSPSMAESKAYQWVSDGKAKPHVYAAIQEAMKARSERTEITQDMVLRELAKIGFSDIRKAIQWGADMPTTNPATGEQLTTNGVRLVDSADIDDSTAAAIQEISETAQGVKVKFYDKKGALVDIGRHLGMFNDKLTLGGDPNNPLKTSITVEFVKPRDREVS